MIELWPVKTLSCFSFLVLFWASTENIILKINVKTDIGHMIADKFSSLSYEEAFIEQVGRYERWCEKQAKTSTVTHINHLIEQVIVPVLIPLTSYKKYNKTLKP